MKKVIMATVLAALTMGVAATVQTAQKIVPFAPVPEFTTAQNVSETVRRALTPPRPRVRTPTACACVRG